MLLLYRVLSPNRSLVGIIIHSGDHSFYKSTLVSPSRADPKHTYEPSISLIVGPSLIQIGLRHQESIGFMYVKIYLEARGKGTVYVLCSPQILIKLRCFKPSCVRTIIQSHLQIFRSIIWDYIGYIYRRTHWMRIFSLRTNLLLRYQYGHEQFCIRKYLES